MSHGVAPQFILIDEFSKRPQRDGKMRRQKCILHAEWETYFHIFSNSFQTDDIPKSQGAGGVGEGLVEGLRDGGEASVALGVKKT